MKQRDHNAARGILCSYGGAREVTPDMTGSYSPELAALSLVIAIFASYTALELAGRVSRKHGRRSAVWLAGGAPAMGTGICAIHFPGMLAFHLLIPVAYD